MSSRRAGVLMRPLASQTGKRAGANGATPSGGATVTPENLWRFPAEQQNVQSLLTSPDFGAGLVLMKPNSNGPYNSSGQYYDAFFRDYFVAGEAFIQNAQNGDMYSAVLNGPNGGGEPFPPINFYASLTTSSGTYTNCFLAQTQFGAPPARPICGSTSLDVFWVGSAQCGEGAGWNYQYTINGNTAATSSTFYVHPRIPDNSVPSPSITSPYRQYDSAWGGNNYDTDCHAPNNNLPFRCNGSAGEVYYHISAKGCYLTDAAILLTYHGYSATPTYSVNPGALNTFLTNDSVGYEGNGNVNPPGVNDYAGSQQSSLNRVFKRTCSTPGCDDADLYNGVCTYGPQIVAVNETGNVYPQGDPRAGQLKAEHFLTVIGQPDPQSGAATTWIIEDPAAQNPASGGPPTSTIPGVQANRHNYQYSDYLEIQEYAGPELPSPPNAIAVELFSPAELVLTDSSGRREGLDPTSGENYTGIPDSDYGATFLIDDDPADAVLGQDLTTDTKNLTVLQPQQGQYTITVTGTGPGTYSMPVYLTDQNAVTNFTELDNVPTNTGVVHQFTFNYSSPFPNSTPGPVALSGAISSANQFLGFASPFVAATLVPSGVNNFPLLIFYGATTYPGTFTASLNGQDIHTLFSPAPGTFQGVNIPLPNGESTLTLQINGTTSSGQITTDTETLLFDVGGSAPSAPTGLTAIPVSTSEIDLTWTASASSGVSNPSVTYSLFRSTTRGFTPSTSNQIASGITGTSYADTGLAVFTKYFYLVEAVTPFASSAASNQATARTQPIVSGGTVSSIRSNFNGTAIGAGDYLWLSAVFQPKSLLNAPVVFFVRNSMITFTANGTNYSIPTPDADITFDPSETTATTNFNASIDQWQTLMPSGGFAGNTLLDAVEFPVPSPGGLPGGIQNVTWTASFSTDTAGVSLNWQWEAAAYSSLGTDYNQLGVKPVDDNKVSQYQNSDPAGTPENYKTYVTGGAMGGGGSNYTGSHSGTTSVNPVVVTSSGGGGSTS